MFKKALDSTKGKFFGLSLPKYLSHPERYQLPENSQFTFIRHSQSSPTVLHERMAAIGNERWGSRGYYRNIFDLTPSKIARLDWYATIMARSQMRSDQAHHAAQEISETLVAEKIAKKENQFLISRENIHEAVYDTWRKYKNSALEPYDEITRELQEVYNLILERVRANTYVPGRFESGTTIDDMVVDIVAVRLTQIEYKRSISDIIDDCFEQAIKDRKLIPLTVRRLEDRTDALFAGGAASGKSTAIEHYAGLLAGAGRSFDDTALIFPDEYLRHFIDEPQRKDPEYLEVRTALTIDATQTMTDIAESKIMRQRTTGVATDTIRETVVPSSDKLTYATDFSGGTISIFITTADLSIVRAREQKRFEKTNRRIPPHFLVTGMSAATNETLRLFQSLPDRDGSPIRLEIYDTSPCQLGDPLCSPTVVATMTGKKSDVYIINFDQLHRFITKTTVITDAASGEVTIPPAESIEPEKSVESLLAHCQDHGSIYFVPLDTQTGTREELKEKSYARFDVANNRLEILDHAQFETVTNDDNDPLSNVLKLLVARNKKIAPTK